MTFHPDQRRRRRQGDVEQRDDEERAIDDDKAKGRRERQHEDDSRGEAGDQHEATCRKHVSARDGHGGEIAGGREV